MCSDILENLRNFTVDDFDGCKTNEESFINENGRLKKNSVGNPVVNYISEVFIGFDSASSASEGDFGGVEDCGKKDEVYEKKLPTKFICDACGLSYSKKAIFDKHIKICSSKPQDLSFLCSRCGKICCSKWQLKQHTMYHKDIRPFPCDQCHRKFRYKTRLNEHLRTHSYVRPFACNKCPRTFNTSSELRKHAKRHDQPGSKMYERVTDRKQLEKCPTCFKLVVNLNAHMYKHGNEEEVRCNICEKRFRSAVSLYAHAKLHTAPNKYSCDVCKRSFNRKYNMVTHRKLHLKNSYKPKIRNKND